MIDVFTGSGNDLFLDVIENIGDLFRSGRGNGHGRFTQGQGVRDGLEATDVGFHHLGNCKDRRVIFGRRNSFAC